MTDGSVRAGMSLPGLVGAAVLWATGLTPSLLPRPLPTAVVLAGVLWAVGYGVGALVGWLVQAATGWRPGDRAAHVGVALAVVVWVAAIVPAVMAEGWQRVQALGLGMPDPGVPWWVLVLGGWAVGWLLVLAGRGLRGLARVVRDALARRSSPALAVTAGVLAPVLLVVGVVVGGYAVLGIVFAGLNAEPTGLAAPTSSLRSGGPGSLVPFDTLGAEGQQFVTGGPAGSDVAADGGTVEPVRVYVGLESASTPADRAALAVDELRRTGAFDRSLLVVAMTTGNGYLDPALVSEPELLTGGDVATVATQYSVLPSWLSFLVDQRASQDEAAALWQAVTAAVDALPEGSRPRLAVSGESLGAFAGQAPFAGLEPEQVVAQADTAVWVGSPATSALWSAWRDGRASGPAWEPVVGNGSIVRAPATADSAQWTAAGWGERRIVLTQHASDPVAWWSPALLWQRPDWLDDPRGPGVDPRMVWLPVVTFLQTGLDLAAAGSVPPGVGHNYGDVTAQAWTYALHRRDDSGG